MAAETLASAGARVTVFDRMPSAGRKFLIAGRGGLNLTHAEPLPRFLGRYRDAPPLLTGAIRDFAPEAVVRWCEDLRQPTFVGTSGRVFPKAMKASPLLRAWLRRLGEQGVEFRPRHAFAGWRNGALVFNTPDGQITGPASACILALGGASWPHLGSSGDWVAAFRAEGISVAPLQPSNCGFHARWSETFAARFAGAPLKDIALSCGGEGVRGEAIITRDGLEGGAIYAMSGSLRRAIDADSEAVLRIDFRPNVSAEAVAARLTAPRCKQSFANVLRKAAHLSPPAIGLLRESAQQHGLALQAMTPDTLASFIKATPVMLHAAAPIERAISSAGGVRFAELDARFMLKRRPGMFVAGEMLDWDAPTGGYLLQACFATGRAAALGALGWLEARNQRVNL
jgi:hypothetical protein